MNWYRKEKPSSKDCLRNSLLQICSSTRCGAEDDAAGSSVLELSTCRPHFKINPSRSNLTQKYRNMSSLISVTNTLGTIHDLLNADNEKERDQLTERWRDNKLQELSFVGIVGGLLANVLTSTNSWPDVLQDGNRTPWTVRACWFSGLVFALAAVLTAASQSIRLHRISCRADANASIRALLRSKARGRRGDVLPKRSHVYLWQTGILYLMCSVFILISGILVLVWSAAGGEDWWNGQAQLAITFTVVACAVGCVFFWEQFTLFSNEGEGDSGNVSL